MTRTELEALDRHRRRPVGGRSSAATLKVTNLDKVLFPARGGEKPVTKRDLAAVRGADRPDAPALPDPAAAEPAPLSRTARDARASGTRSCPATRRTGCPAGTTRTRTRARRRRTWSSTSRPRWCGRRTSARWSGTPGRRGSTTRTGRPTRWSTSTRAADTTWADLLALARLHRDGVRAPRRRGPAEGDRPARHPDLGPDRRRGPTFDETRAWVERLSRTVGAVVPELVSWKWQVARARRAGPAGLHPERDQQDPGRAVQPAGRRRGAGVRADRLGRARRPRAAPDRFTIRTILRPPRRARRPVRPGAHHPPAPPTPPLTRFVLWTVPGAVGPGLPG